MAETDNSDRERLRQVGRKVRAALAANKSVHRLPVEQAEVWAVPDFLDATECGRLIELIERVARPSTTFDADYSTGFRTSYSGDVDPLDPFIRTVKRRIDRLLDINPANGEPIQGQRYRPGQQFKAHNDWFPAGTPFGEQEIRLRGQRSFTAMAYLNRVEAGGATDFPRLGIAVDPRPGMLLVWNNADAEGEPNPFTRHAGLPVERGVKYVITKWYRTRRWA